MNKRKFKLGDTVKLNNRDSYDPYYAPDEYSKVLKVVALYDDSHSSQYKVVPYSYAGKGKNKGKHVLESDLDSYEQKKLFAYSDREGIFLFSSLDTEGFLVSKTSYRRDKNYDIILEGDE